jgi:GT2 family glycosyltransferase
VPLLKGAEHQELSRENAQAIGCANWNGETLLADCLSSLSNQTLSDLEVLLVDNGSSDGSVDYVRTEFPGIRVIALEKNLGFSAGNNRGIEASSSEFVALFNNDAVAERQWAERLLAPAADSKVGIVASKVMLFSERDRLDSAGDGMTIVGVAYKRGHLEAADRYPATESVFGASGCAMLLRRSMLDDIGLLDEDFFLSYEDSDVCFRAQLRGWKCVYAPEARVYHRLNSSIGRLSSRYVYYGQRNAEFLYFKNMPGWLMWKYLPAHLLNIILALAYFTGRGHCWTFIRSKIGFLKALPAVLAKRRQIQSRRTISCRDLDPLLEKRWLRTRLAGN